MAFSRTHYPRTPVSGYSPLDVAKAYRYPANGGAGGTCAIIELGGGFGAADLAAYFPAGVPDVAAVSVDGGANKSDGPDGADGEVLLDIEVAASIAPDAKFRVYFAPNTDSGFYDAFKQAIADLSSGDVISCSWGGPEDSWDSATMVRFDALFATARAKGVAIMVASGDNGSGDGETGRHVDFPASSPNVLACGGTRLTINPDGSRATETVWNDNPSSSATGGGVSVQFPGRDVPDVAGNADPETGYRVIVDGQHYVIGGTSAVAPLYAGLHLVLRHATGRAIDWLTFVPANPTVCFDVTSGDNGAFRAGPGRDETTGFGVVDGTLALAKLQGQPAPTPPAPQPQPPVPPVTQPPLPAALVAELDGWSVRTLHRAFASHADVKAAEDWQAYRHG